MPSQEIIIETPLDSRTSDDIMRIEGFIDSYVLEISSKTISNTVVDIKDAFVSLLPKTSLSTSPLSRCKVLSPEFCIYYRGVRDLKIFCGGTRAESRATLTLIDCRFFASYDAAKTYLVTKELKSDVRL